MKGLIGSKNFKITAIVLAAIIVVLASFSIGMNVGLHKAKFSYRFGENYEKNFLAPHSMMQNDDRPMNNGQSSQRGTFPPDMKNFEDRGFRNAHGLAGEIISISDNNLVIKDTEEKENSVQLSDKTILKSGRETIEIENLKTGDKVVVIGNPDENGTIIADLIRIFNQN